MANIVAKSLVCGGLAAILAAAVPSSALADYADFGGPPVTGDPYNEMLAATMPAAGFDVRFSGGLMRLDPYNATLAAAVLPSLQSVTVEDLYASYAFAPEYDGPRVWESSTPPKK